MVKIGSTTINTNVFLAPMSGCTDLAFRLIAREYGAKFCFFEMLDSNALTHGHKKTLGILKTSKSDRPIAAQLLGRDPIRMLDAAQKLLDVVNVSFLDINSACPAKKVIKKGAGASLLKTPHTLFKIVSKLSSELPIPVTVKLRIGYSKKDLKGIIDIAKECEKSGASSLFVHGRTRLDGYMGDIDYKAIKTIKNSLKIPVFGSGNIFTGQLAKKMFRETGCDGILVARGALGNPWIFKNIESYLKKGKIQKEITLRSKKRTLKKHLSYIKKYKESKGESKLGFMRKVAMWYLKSTPYASKTRLKITMAKTYRELADLIESL